MTRSVNMDAPDYLEGAEGARELLDHGDGVHADVWIAFAEEAADLHHRNENIEGYHYARGFLDTFRDYTQDQAL
jgi:hypothetical protein